MVDLDLTAFGSQRAIPKVALVVIRHVVDREREHYLGLHDDEWSADQPPERPGTSTTSFIRSPTTTTSSQRSARNTISTSPISTRLHWTLAEQLDEQGLHDAVCGQNLSRDPNLSELSVGSSA